MINPPQMTDQNSPQILGLRISLDMERWLTPQYCQPESHLIFKSRFSLDMVKDDWPPSIADQNLPENFEAKI